MKHAIRILSAALAVSLMGALSPMSTAQTEPSAQVTKPDGKMRTHRFRQDGHKRRYMIYSPANEGEFTGPRPLVLVIHGGGSSDRGMAKLDKKRWQELADTHGFYVVYPNAVDRLWDFGEGVTSEDLDKRVDDLAYFTRVMNDVSRRKNIDQRRIFATGISRGGQSSYYLACNMPERIRAVMPVAMSLPEFMLDECRTGPPVGIAIVNGTDDPQVPYNGGPIKVFRKLRDVVLPTEATVDLWRERNGCSGLPTTTAVIDKPGDKTSVNMTAWTDCGGAPVKFFKVNNGGHTWPGGIQYLNPRIVGHTSRDINASEEGWAFFSQFR